MGFVSWTPGGQLKCLCCTHVQPEKQEKKRFVIWGFTQFSQIGIEGQKRGKAMSYGAVASKNIAIWAMYVIRGITGTFLRGGAKSLFWIPSRHDFSIFPVKISILVDPEKVSVVSWKIFLVKSRGVGVGGRHSPPSLPLPIMPLYVMHTNKTGNTWHFR